MSGVTFEGTGVLAIDGETDDVPGEVLHSESKRTAPFGGPCAQYHVCLL